MKEGKKQANEKSHSDIMARVVSELTEHPKGFRGLTELCPEGLPSLTNIKQIISLLWQLIFPELFCERTTLISKIDYRIGIATERLFDLLCNEIAIGLTCVGRNGVSVDVVKENLDKIPSALAIEIIEKVPEIKELLYTDIHAIMRKDPAAGNEVEIIMCYPSIKAMLHHRFASLLFGMNIPYLPRIISELAHSSTGIDIHPGARIGHHFAIDHGTGVVIGETCIIGNNVTLYQGVTLGAKSFSYDDDGIPKNVPRHPIIENDVTIYSNASVLGRITIGHHSVIGGNVWVTDNVAPYSKIIQGGVRNTSYTDGAGI